MPCFGQAWLIGDNLLSRNIAAVSVVSVFLLFGCARVNHRGMETAGDGGSGEDGASGNSGSGGKRGSGSGAGGSAGSAGKNTGAGGASGRSGSGGTVAAGSAAPAGHAAEGGAGAAGAAGSIDPAGAGGAGAGAAGEGGTQAGTAGSGEAGTGEAAGAGSGGSDGAGAGGNSAGAGGTSPTDCGADDLACTPAQNVQGFCKAHVCVACAPGSAGDVSCSAAYGNGAGYLCAAGNCIAGQCLTTAQCGAGQLCAAGSANQCGACANDAQCTASSGYGAGYLCLSGACVAADCRGDFDCTSGQICGLNTPNHCGACSTDQQCRNDTASYGPNYICNTSTQRCVSASCSMNNRACSANPADFCCGGSCVAGNCCSNADCTSLGNNFACTNHVCTLCQPASGNTYYVDPVSGSDSVGTGNAAVGCMFRTISRALSVIGSSAPAGTRVLVLPTGAVGVATNGEAFPIDVPRQVVIGGSGNRVQVNVPANTNGFQLHSPGSGLTNLTIDGQNHSAGYGIYVSSGADDTTTISSLDVQNMGLDGIRLVGTAVLNIAAGVQSLTNGTSAKTADGLYVTDQARAKINVTSGTAVHFDHNAGRGIYVSKSGALELTATASVNGAGTVTANLNSSVGVWIEQTAGSNPPANTISGLVSWANSSHGLRIVAGSNARVRNSFLLANGGSGVIVATYVNGNTRNSDTSKIDLGTSTGPSYGGNTLQAGLGSNPNAGAGVCLAVDRAAGAVLNAAGNIFSGPTNCAASTSILRKNTRCNGSVDSSVRNTGFTANTIVVTRCQ